MQGQRIAAVVTLSLSCALAAASCADSPAATPATDRAPREDTKDIGDDPDIGPDIGSETPVRTGSDPGNEPQVGDMETEPAPAPEGSIALDMCVAAGKAGFDARGAFCRSILVPPQKKQGCWSRQLLSVVEWIGWCNWNF
jgi:hypothetical protein